MFAYSNNGYSMRAWNDPNNLLSGEIYFDHVPTIAEIQSAFPNYSNGPILTKDQQLTALNQKYSIKLDQLKNCYSAVTLALTDAGQITTNQTAIKAQYQSLMTELSTKRTVILNG